MMVLINDIISTLEDTRHETLYVLRYLDLEAIVYSNSGWRVHDIITHLTWFDEHAMSLIQAFLTDTVHELPEQLTVQSRADIHRRNACIRRQRYTKSQEDVMTEFISAHNQLKSAIYQVGMSRLHHEFTAYWGERITTHTLAIWQIQHDQHHRRDLSRLLGLSDVLDKRIYNLVYSDV